MSAASAHGTFELTTSLRMTRARDSELEYLTFRCGMREAAAEAVAAAAGLRVE